jgi:hypothetical protein
MWHYIQNQSGSAREEGNRDNKLSRALDHNRKIGAASYHARLGMSQGRVARTTLPQLVLDMVEVSETGLATHIHRRHHLQPKRALT